MDERSIPANPDPSAGVVGTEETNNSSFMDLSAIGNLLEQQMGCSSITVTVSDQTGQRNPGGSMHPPGCGRFLGSRPPPYPSGLTPYQTPYVSPYATPFQTPSPSPLSSVHSSPVSGGGPVFGRIHPQGSKRNSKGGIDEELAMILESDPFLWQDPPANPPPPYPQRNPAVTGRPPQAPPSRTQLKQQLQRQQLEQQERRERERAALQQPSASCPPERMPIPASGMRIPVVSPLDPVDPVSVPAQVLTVRTRLENPTLYHVMESRKRQVREFLQQGSDHGQPDKDHYRPVAVPTSSSSAPPGGFIDSAAAQTAEPASIATNDAEV